LVEIESDLATLSFKNLDYLEKEDLIEAGKLIDNPGNYLFRSILDWPEKE
jgi:hypothetical protein